MTGLTRFELRWAYAALGAMFPGSERAGLVSIRCMDIRSFLAGLLRAFPLRAGLGVRLAIWMVAFAPLFVLGRWTTIRGLRQAERERLVACLMASPRYAVRQLVTLLKAAGALLYAAAPQVRARMLGAARHAGTLVPLRLGRDHVAA